MSGNGQDERKYLAVKKGYKSTAGIFTRLLEPLLGTVAANMAFRLNNGILPGFAIDARGSRFSKLLKITNFSRLESAQTLVDIKGSGIGDSSGYVSFRAEQGQLKPIDRQAVEVHKKYCEATKDLDSKHRRAPDDENCPVKSALLSFGPVWRANTRTRFSGSASAASESYCTCWVQWRLYVYRAQSWWYPIWVAMTTSRPRRPILGVFRSRSRRV